MDKLVKDLKTGDLVYVVELHSDRIVECKIRINFTTWTYGENKEYSTQKFDGYLDSGKTKFKTHGYSGQVIRVSTVRMTDPNKKIPTKVFNAYSEKPGGIRPEVFDTVLNSNSFKILAGMIVFTSKEDAKNYIIDRKLEDIKKELAKVVKVIKYHSEEK